MYLPVNANISHVNAGIDTLMESIPIGLHPLDFWRGIAEVWFYHTYMQSVDLDEKLSAITANLLSYRSESISEYLFTLETRLFSGRSVRTENGYNDGVRFYVDGSTEDIQEVVMNTLHTQIRGLLSVAANRAHPFLLGVVSEAHRRGMVVDGIEVERVKFGLLTGRLRCHMR